MASPAVHDERGLPAVTVEGPIFGLVRYKVYAVGHDRLTQDQRLMAAQIRRLTSA